MEKTNLTANKELATKFFENFGKGNIEVIENLLAENYKFNLTGVPQPLNKVESIEKIKEYLASFPDLKLTIQLQLADGEYVITRTTGKATHKADFNGIEATNKKVTVNGITIQRIVKNKIVEETTEFDALGLIQ